jgi:hypothetical protein
MKIKHLLLLPATCLPSCSCGYLPFIAHSASYVNSTSVGNLRPVWFPRFASVLCELSCGEPEKSFGALGDFFPYGRPTQARFWLEWGSRQRDTVFPPPVLFPA